jgi:hypothetical protein
MSKGNWVIVSVLIVAGCGLTGCNKSATRGPANGDTKTQVSDKGDAAEGWWCSEHGVPEEVCAQCNEKLAADFKAKGDWCKEHDRPESQCFICHPEYKAKFAALYEARYGKKAPEPEAELK